MACSGLSSTASAPCSRPVHSTNSRRSPRSPIPHERTGVQRVELQHPAPRPRRLRQRGRCHDHGDLAAELLVDQLQAVVAGFEVVGQLGDVDPRALGVDQHARTGQRPDRADPVSDRARQGAQRSLLAGACQRRQSGPRARPRRRRAGRGSGRRRPRRPRRSCVHRRGRRWRRRARPPARSGRSPRPDRSPSTGSPRDGVREISQSAWRDRGLRAFATPAQTTTTLSAPSRCSTSGSLNHLPFSPR